MITIISATNRPNSKTRQVSTLYQQMFSEMAVDVQVFSLDELTSLVRDEAYEKLERQFLLPVKKFVFVMPEYNGSFPGILKLMMDLSDVKNCWWYKKAMLVGVADGRGGNLRGLEHMTNILNYLRMNVLYNKIPLSKINDEINTEGKLLSELTHQSIVMQVKEFIDF